MVSANFSEQDHYWMGLALEQARLAAEQGEVPVGAVLIKDHELVASAYNQTISLNDPSAHAEVLVMRRAGEVLENYRLIECDLFVTIEPCMMCAGAMVHARLRRITFGAAEPKAGVLKSQLNIYQEGFLNHKPELSYGLMEKECSELMSGFFRERRQQKRL